MWKIVGRKTHGCMKRMWKISKSVAPWPKLWECNAHPYLVPDTCEESTNKLPCNTNFYCLPPNNSPLPPFNFLWIWTTFWNVFVLCCLYFIDNCCLFFSGKITCTTSVNFLRRYSRNFKKTTVSCPQNCSQGYAYVAGTTHYSYSSSICVAGIHAGLIVCIIHIIKLGSVALRLLQAFWKRCILCSIF